MIRLIGGKDFCVMRLSRYDLQNTELSREQILALTDADMEVIAEQMDCFIEDYSFDKQMWEHVYRIANRLIQTSKQEES